MSNANGRKPLIYLASPYSHPDEKIMYARFTAVCRKAVQLMRSKSVLVFSPIAHSHCLALHMKAGMTDFAAWQEIDLRMIRMSDRLWVYRLDGWDRSTGVRAEIAYAKEIRKPVEFVD